MAFSAREEQENYYEDQYERVKNNPLFVYDDWRQIAEGNVPNETLDKYVYNLLEFDKRGLDTNAFKSDIGWEHSDTTNRLASLDIELWANRDNVDEVRTKLKRSNGKYVGIDGTLIDERYTTDQDKLATDTFPMSDYDYFKSIIKENNRSILYKQIQDNEQARKDELNGFLKFLNNTVVSPALDVTSGAMDALDNMTGLLQSTSAGVKAILTGGDFSDAFAKESVERYSWSQSYEDWVVDFERKYTSLRDINGNYTTYGKIVGGVATSLGQMLPSMAIGAMTGGIGTALHLSPAIAGKIGSVVSQLIFYGQMTQGNVKEMYSRFASDGVSVCTDAILHNAAIKSTLQWGVERALGSKYLFGSSGIDKMVFGYGTKSIASKTLTRAGLKRVGKDFLQEGLEEVFQDTSDFLVDRAFMDVINTNFGKITDLSFQSLADAFIIGGLASFAGNAGKIAKYSAYKTFGKGISTDIVKTNSKGEVTTKKLNAIAAWEYGLDASSFTNNYDTVIKLSKGEKSSPELDLAYKEMYASARMLSSIYTTIGEERFSSANKILETITNKIKSGHYDIDYEQSAKDLMHLVRKEGPGLVATAINSEKAKLKEAKLAGVIDVAVRDGKNVDIGDKSTKDKLLNLFKSNRKINKVVVTETGERPVVIGDTLAVPTDVMSLGNTVVENAVAEQQLVDDVMSIDKRILGTAPEQVLNLYKDTINSDGTYEDAVRQVLYDDSFFEQCLYSGDSNMYKLLIAVTNIANSKTDNDAYTSVFREKVKNIVKSKIPIISKYLVMQPFAIPQEAKSLLNEAEIDNIERKRYANNLMKRASNGLKLTQTEYEFLDSKIDKLPASDDKKTLKENLRSKEKYVRDAVLRKVELYYSSVFIGQYDGTVYLPTYNKQNVSFNQFLQSIGKNLQNFLDIDALTDAEISAVSTYGELSSDTLLTYRQEQYSKYCNDAYSFAIDTSLKIMDPVTNAFVINPIRVYNTDDYEDVAPTYEVSRNVDESTFVKAFSDTAGYSTIIEPLLSKDINNSTKTALTINDIIENPDLLAENIIADIRSKYGVLNYKTAFIYVRDTILKQSEGLVSVGVSTTGNFVLLDVLAYKTSLKIDSKTIISKSNKPSKITDVMSDKVLTPRTRDTKIQYVSRKYMIEKANDSAGYFDETTNTIYVCETTLGTSLALFTILHEFQHAIQYSNNLVAGFTTDFLQDDKQSALIVSDIKEHVPSLFTDCKTYEDELKVANSFLYKSTAEYQAFGLESTGLKFYPVSVVYSNGKYKIVMPWGSVYDVNTKLNSRLEAMVGDGTVDGTVELISEDLHAAWSKLNKLKYDRFIVQDGKYVENPNVSELTKNIDIYNERLGKTLYTKNEKVFDYYMASLGEGDVDNSPQKRALYLELKQNPNLKTQMMTDWYNHAIVSGLDASKCTFEQFLEMDIPFVRLFVGKTGHYEDYFSSVCASTLAPQQMAFSMTNQWKTTVFDMVDDTMDYVIYAGTLKPKDTVGYIADGDYEALIPTTVLKNSKQYLGKLNKYGLYGRFTDITPFSDNDGYYSKLTALMDLLIRKQGISKTYPDFYSTKEYRDRANNVAKFAEYIYRDPRFRGAFDLTKNYIIALDSYSASVGNKFNIQKAYIELANNHKEIMGYHRSACSKLANAEIAPGVDYKQFLDTQYNFVTIDEQSSKYKFAEGVYGNITPASMSCMLDRYFNNPNTDLTIPAVIRFGTSTPRSLMSFTPNTRYYSDMAMFVKSAINPVSTYYVSKTPDGYIVKDEQGNDVNNTYEISPNEDAKPKSYMARPKGVEVTERKTKKGVYEEVVTKSKSKDKGVITEVKKRYKGYENRTYITKAMRKTTKLKNWKTDYIEKDTLQFVLNSTSELPKELGSRIDNGTLTKTDVMTYVRTAEHMSETTFDLIRDSYFKNTAIKSFKQLVELTRKNEDMYAVSKIVYGLDQGESLMLADTEDAYERALKIIDASPEYTALLGKYKSMYTSFSGTSSDGTRVNRALEIDDAHLRRLYLEWYDGSLKSSMAIASAARQAAVHDWDTTSYKRTVDPDATVINKNSTSDITGTIATAYSTLSEEELSSFLDTIRDMPVDKKVAAILEHLKKRDVIALAKSAKVAVDEQKITKDVAKEKLLSETERRYNEKMTYLKKRSDEEIDKEFDKFINMVKSGFVEDIDDLYVSVMSSELMQNNSALDIAKSMEDKDHAVFTRTNANIVSAMKGRLSTISINLSKKEMAKLVKDNLDILNEDGTLRTDVYQDVVKNRPINKSVELLAPLEQRIINLSNDVKDGKYDRDKAIRYKNKAQRTINKLTRRLNIVTEKLKTATQPVVITVAEEPVIVNTGKEVPDALVGLLEYTFDKTAKTQVQFMDGDTKEHIKTQVKNFTKDNAEYLSKLSQADIDDILDFYMDSEIIPTTNTPRKYAAIQMTVLAYIYSSVKNDGMYILTEEQLTKLHDRLFSMPSMAGQILANWRSVMETLRPASTIVSKMGELYGIEFEETTLQALANAITTRNPEAADLYRKQLYNEALEKYTGRKRHFADRMLQFQHAAMLSSPGTWLRNITSNIVLYTTNTASETVGKYVSNLITKVFPKSGRVPDTIKSRKQYELVGTVVSDDVKQFIQKDILESNLYNEIRDGLTKLDARKMDTHSESFTLAELISSGIASEISRKTSVNNKYVREWYNFIFKRLSDDKFVKKTFIRTLGKMLTEDNVNVSKGMMNQTVQEYIVTAYKFAAAEYMHKTNIFNTIDAWIRSKWGPWAYFAWKQILPFASASWNWFSEGLNYTPIGLGKAIYQYAKLENTIAKAELKEQQDKSLPFGRFAKYITERNIGKGIIGTCGFIIGSLLAGSGLAKIDEEDGEYKLNIGDTYIDISSIFGMQGIFMGIVLFGSVKDEDMNVMDVVNSVITQTLNDSIMTDFYNTFRYKQNIGDYVMDIPFKVVSMFIPNLIKSISFTNKYKVAYERGIVGKLEKLLVQAVPSLAYALPHQIDPYTGEDKVMYKVWFLSQFLSKYSPVKVQPYSVSKYEKEAISVGIERGQLTGSYKINNEKIRLTKRQVDQLNSKYGELNKIELERLMSNSAKYNVLDEKTKTYVSLTYKNMTDKQKATIVNSIMNYNSGLAKIYIMTQLGYDYYASDKDYEKLKKMGVKKVYKKTKDKSGLVKS